MVSQTQNIQTNSLLTGLALRESNAVKVTKSDKKLINKDKQTETASTVYKYDEATKVTISKEALYKLDKYNTDMKDSSSYPNGTPDSNKPIEKDDNVAQSNNNDNTVPNGTPNIGTLLAKLHSTKIYRNRY